jgi:DNA-binding response OmpR family regulator
MSGGATILIADDDALWVQSMTRLLDAEGYKVVPVRTGVDALYQAGMRRPDLILLTPALPQLSGWRVCRKLMTQPNVTRPKIVMLTLDGEAAYRAGADGYLVKGGQAEPTLPPIRVFRYPAQGILGDFLRRRALAA